MAKTLRIDTRNWKDWLQVRPSIIPGAGRGIFACKNISARTVLGKYHGRHLHELRDVYETKDDRYVIDVTLPDRKTGWIDGNVPSNYLRFVNGTKTHAEQKYVNVEAYQYGGGLWFRSTRPINAGQELILDYSDEHWESYSNVDGIKYRNDGLLTQIETELEKCADFRERAALRGMMWLVRQMSSVGAYYSFFVGYLWMFYEFRLSRCKPAIADIATRVLTLELDGAQFRLNKIFAPNLEDKWHFISLIPMLAEVQAEAEEYAKFYRSYFPRSLKYYDESFNEFMKRNDFVGMVAVLMDHCFVEMARRHRSYSRLFRLPKSRFLQYWRTIRQFGIDDLEASVTNDDEQFDLDYQVVHLVMCRYGFGSRVLAPASRFDQQIVAYLMRHERRILDESNDLDLIAELAYCYLELKIQKGWVQKAIKKILDSQNADGSWGTEEEMRLPMYDRTHATWTAVTALCHSLAKQVP